MTNSSSPLPLTYSSEQVSQAVESYRLLEAQVRLTTAQLEQRLTMQRFRPSRLYPTILRHDGLRWTCEYAMSGSLVGIEHPDAIAYGMSPEEAMQNFDKMWLSSVYDGGTENGSKDEDVSRDA